MMFNDFLKISVPSMHIYKHLLFVRRDIYDGVEAGWNASPMSQWNSYILKIQNGGQLPCWKSEKNTVSQKLFDQIQPDGLPLFW